MENKFDYVVVGAGLFGAAFAFAAKNLYNKKVLIVEKSDRVGGACYTEEKEGVIVHKFGPHIFHTNNKKLWDWVNSLEEFKPFINQPIAKYEQKIYNLPFNMNTFYQLYGAETPEAAKALIEKDKIKYFGAGLDDFCYRNFGRKLYLTLIKDYTEKQWGRKCADLPTSLVERIPLRFEFNNNYFNDVYQGVPVNGYTALIEKMIEGIPILYNTSYKDMREMFPDISAEKVIYTGAIDEYYDYCLGALEYRSLKWDEKYSEQGCAVINYTDTSTPYTRSIEHKWFMGGDPSLPALCSYELPLEWEEGMERYYPIPTDNNLTLYYRYLDLAKEKDPNVIFCGRIGGYKYINMDTAIEQAMNLAKKNP